MSKTDKDRPLWVQNAEHGIIDHDHRNGECIVSNDQRDRWPSWQHHYMTCKKRVTVEFECHPEKVNGKREIVYPDGIELPDRRYGWMNRRSTDKCWVWTCDCPYTPVYTYGVLSHRQYEDGTNWHHGAYCDYRYFVKCRGHSVLEYDDSIPCSCDDRPEPATCTPAWKVGSYYTYGGVPSWFVRTIYHSPERRREREDLRAMAREYNAYGDIEDDDFDNHQARNSCRWTWW